MTPFGPGNIKQAEGAKIVENAFKCDECGRLSVGSMVGGPEPANTIAESMQGWWRLYSPRVWSPNFVEGQAFDDVPQHIGDAAGEAYKSLSIGNIKSAILMARTVIEATAKEKNITKGTLYNKIDEMATQNIIKDFTRQTAHAIRLFGNDMAHGDIEQSVDVEDAKLVLGFMSELLSEVFQNPAKLTALQAALQARQTP